eukprot:CAMPEP_0198139016 /NCGR_PEP_ID=MMETSP1443-20131203/2350_1 /TAXON_ID=186043 /ORGANISM="Entomoneis sp., Strain CCMP2396" /LENGTH=343 /DNA_ID=CAMNT_0043800989 /DNA_START=303 /DNA_END=1334 /DNA_ORIENTATION=+
MLVDWIQSKGGVFNPKLEIRKADPSDPNSFYGMFANEEIEEDGILMQIPRDYFVTSELDDPEWICNTTRNLVREMKLGDSSRDGPYVNYLKDQPRGQLPSSWSKKGRSLLLKVTGGSSDDQIIPPKGPVDRLNWWKSECDGGDDEFEQHVFLMVMQRGWDDILIPVFDMMNHRNGKWLNTKETSVYDEDQPDVVVKARKHIQAGDEIYTSYDECEDCVGRADTYGTPDILRDYGFVEIFPQKWIFEDQEVAFKLDENEEGELELEWISDEADEEDLKFFDEQIKRLQDLWDDELSHSHEKIPENEIRTIQGFAKASIRAMEAMRDFVRGDMARDASEGTCGVS